MMENFHQINVRHQLTDPGSSENIKLVEYQKNTPRHTIFKSRKKNPETSYLQRSNKKNYIWSLLTTHANRMQWNISGAGEGHGESLNNLEVNIH